MITKSSNRVSLVMDLEDPLGFWKTKMWGRKGLPGEGNSLGRNMAAWGGKWVWSREKVPHRSLQKL